MNDTTYEMNSAIRQAGFHARSTDQPRVCPIETLSAEWYHGWDLANGSLSAMGREWTAEDTASLAAAALAPKVTEDELTAFAQAVWNNLVAYYTEHYPRLEKPTVRVEKGSKFARIVVIGSENSRSVYCFVELSSGNILKAAGWKAPAKHARGNIRHGDQSNWWDGALNATGATYLR